MQNIECEPEQPSSPGPHTAKYLLCKFEDNSIKYLRQNIDVGFSENYRALRLAMLQREERRIMFNLNDNLEFASGKIIQNNEPWKKILY